MKVKFYLTHQLSHLSTFFHMRLNRERNKLQICAPHLNTLHSFAYLKLISNQTFFYEFIENLAMKEPQVDKQMMDSDSDSAPESVPFNESKSENAIQSSKIKDQVKRFFHFFFVFNYFKSNEFI